MALAVVLGVLIATGRVYGDPITRLLLTVYVEVMRGTPVLLQLFVIYYGLASVIRLPAFIAALLGTGPELRRLRKRDLSQRARSRAARTARCGAHSRLQPPADAAADSRAAGVPSRARADDQRLRRAAEGLVARVDAHRRRADQADADLRDQHRQLGHSRACCARCCISRCRCRSATSRAGSKSGGGCRRHDARTRCSRRPPDARLARDPARHGPACRCG